MISINWTIFDVTDDVGVVQYYIVQFNNLTSTRNIKIQPSENEYNLTYLRPYTNFTIKIQAVTKVGLGLWSSLKTVTTKIAGKYLTPELYLKSVKHHQKLINTN